jgi:hypothetical protein
MPLLLCSRCHHEFESKSFTKSCDWCGCKFTIVLEKETPFEMFLTRYLQNTVETLKNLKKGKK